MKLLKPMRTMPTEDEGSGPVLPQFMALLDRCQGFISKLGIDYAQYRLIVQTKLKLAVRDHVGVGMNANTKKEQGAHPLRSSFLLYLVIGVLFCLYLVMPMPKFYMFSAYFGILFVMTFLNMLTSYSGLMLDPRDHALYTVRGVSTKTLNAARLTVVGMYLILNVVAIGGPGVVPVFMRFGLLAAIGQVIAVLLLGVFSFMLALFIYLVVLRYFDGERLKNILNLVQIAMMIGIYLASQILPHLDVNLAGQSGAVQAFVWYFIFVIPMWFAGIPLLLLGEISLLSIVMTVLAVVVTATLTVVYAHHASEFEESLTKLNNSTGKRHKPSWYFRLTQKIFCRGPLERTYFGFGWAIIREDREYKLRVYPQLAYGVIIPVIFLFSFVGIGGTVAQSLPMMRHFLPYMILGVFFGMPIALWSLGFSEQPGAMRLFQRVPLIQQGLLLRGIVKAMFVRVCLPVTLLLAAVFTGLSGMKGLVASAAMVVLIYALTMLFGRLIAGVDLPFSREFDPAKRGGTAGIIWIQMLSMPLIAFIVAVGGFTNGFIMPAIVLVVALVATVIIENGYKNGVRFDVRRI
ncbi:hypothetical protein [Lacticaseibacillus hulanensis]|uniref:hypothetical protein n=1 Tax=Lacticaseibacillus hulanensis TaxID=2493111 RepID=UPI000FD94C44|nr:hypothetical protein [Lacticaseibacillus hulanensis]